LQGILVSTITRTGPVARLILAAAVACCVAGNVQAQTEDSIAEIVVTARKIEENLREVPLAITAFTADQIQSARINNLADLASLTPGLQFYNPFGEILPVPVIRGVAPTDIFGENNVGVFLDGAYVAGREGINFSQLDIERIEVIKGPLSALYGRSTFMGAINYVIKKPEEEFTVVGDASVGNDGYLIAKMSVGGPILGESFRGRIAALYDEFDGSYNNPIPGGNPDVGGHKYRTLLGSLVYEPGDVFDATLSLYYSDDEVDDSAFTSVQSNCEDTALFNPVYQDDDGVPVGINYGTYCGKLPKLSGTSIPKTQFATGEERDVTRGVLTLNWNLDVGTITSLTGYSYTEQSSATDFNRDFGNSMPFYYCTGTSGIFGDPPDVFCTDPNLGSFTGGVVTYDNGAKTTDISQELRFTSALDQPTRYSVAAYYYDTELKGYNQDNVIYNADLPDEPFNWCPCQKLGNLWLAPFGGFIFDPSLVRPPEFLLEQTNSDAWALFGWFEQDFLDGFTARLELRYTDESRELNLYGLNPVSRSDNWGALTGRAELKYQLSDKWMTYAYVANAQKSGGFDYDVEDLVDPVTSEVILDVPVVVVFDPEKNITYELGAKGVNESGNFAIDLALFYIDWTEVVLPQVFTSIDGKLISGGAITLNQNTGTASVTGFELGSDFRIDENWFGRVALSYQDAVWDDAAVQSLATWPSFEPDGNVTGNQVQRQSPWQASGTLQYSHEIRDGWNFFGRGDVSWLDESFTGNDNFTTVPSHTYVNLSLGVENGRYRVALWGNNIFSNEEPTTSLRIIYWTNTSGADADGQGDLRNPATPLYNDLAAFPVFNQSVSHPRLATYGIQFTGRFGGPDD